MTMDSTCGGCQNPLASDETAVIKDGFPYCCFGCAQGKSCTCDRGTRGEGDMGRPSMRRSRVLPLEALLNEPWS
jgi:hypothetical protein